MGGAGYATPRTDGLSIASLIAGIVSLVCSCACLGVLVGPAAAIMGYIAKQRVDSSGGAVRGGGFALAGIVLGILGFVLSVVFFFLYVSGDLSSLTNSTPSP